MRMNRRNVLVGLGGIVAGGGALLGTGAFSTVEADRTANIQVADDSNAFLSLEATDSDDPYVEDGDQIVFHFDGRDSDAEGLNENAVTQFKEILTVENNGTEQVNLSVNTVAQNGNDVDIGLSVLGADDPLAPDDGPIKIGFEFDLTDAGGDVNDVEYFRITASSD